MKRILYFTVLFLPVLVFAQSVSPGVEEKKPIRNQRIKKVAPRKPVIMAKELKRLLKDYVKHLDLTPIGTKEEGAVVVKGRVTTQDNKEKVQKILESYPVGQIVDLIDYRVSPQMIGIEVAMVIVDKSNGDEFNADILSSMGATYGGKYDFTGGGALTSHFLSWSVVTNFDKLNYWITSGKADIRSEPGLLVENGGSGSILIGGEIPYQVATSQGTGVEYKEYGTKIDVSPKLLKSGNIEMDITVNLSKPDMSLPTPKGGIGYMKKELKTKINVKNKQTVCIGAFNYRSKGSVSKSGCLFPLPSIKYNNENKYMYILLTPHIPMNTLNSKIYKKGY